MNDDRIRQLINLADSVYTPAAPQDQSHLLAAAKHIAQRRRRNQTTLRITSLAILFIGVGITALVNPSTQRGATQTSSDQKISQADTPQATASPTSAAPSTDTLAEQIATLESQLSAKQEVIDALLAADRAAPSASPRYSDALQTTRDQIELAAFVIVHQADRKRTEPGLAPDAEADYRRVIELFPQTTWADQARSRLASVTF